MRAIEEAGAAPYPINRRWHQQRHNGLLIRFPNRAVLYEAGLLRR